MAQDSSAPAAAPSQDIDLDELEVNILILAKNPNNMKQTCAFLTRRGWPAAAMGNMSKAIEEIAEKRPDIVMVSFNHPSPAVLKLPDLIAQTFNLICVGFVEGTDTASTSKLNTVKIRHKIFGTPSGPNFHRGIRRILAEKYNIKDEKAEAAERKASGANNVTVRGSKDGEEDDIVGELESSGKSERGTTVVSGGGTNGAQGGPGGSRSGRKLNSIGQGDALDDDDSGIMQLGHGTGTAKSASQDGNAGSLMKAGTGGKGATTKSATTAGAGSDSDLETTDNSPLGKVMQMGLDAGKKGDRVIGKGGRRKLKEVTGEDKPKPTPGDMVLGENQEANQAQAQAESKPLSEADLAEQAAVQKDLVGMLKASLFGDRPEDTSPLGILEQATEKALQQVCVPNPDIKPMILKMVSHVGVFPIDSEILPGFLVLALEVPAAEDQKRFLKNCENNLIATFESMGVQAKLQPGFWLDVPETSFQQWVETAGAFNFKLTHKGSEVGVSYFQTEKNLPKASVSHEKGMHTIDLAEISTAEPVTFKAYLYLKENKKFYLYLRNGRQLQDEQKERLATNKVGQIFLKDVDLENLRMYLSAAYLKETIRTSKDAA